MKSRLIPIVKTPLLLEFFSVCLDKLNLDLNIDMDKELFITDYCRCGQKDCSSVYLKSSKDFDESIQGIYDFSSNKGIIILHIKENGYIELEALDYYYFPYKIEVKNLFSKQAIRLNKKKYKSVQNYFNKL